MGGSGKIKLWEAMNPGRAPGQEVPPPPPAFAARFYDEYKQHLMSSFFGKKSNGISPAFLAPLPSPPLTLPLPKAPIPPPSFVDAVASTSTLAPRSSLFANYARTSIETILTASSIQRNGKQKETSSTKEQKPISSFFQPPPSRVVPPKPTIEKKRKRKQSTPPEITTPALSVSLPTSTQSPLGASQRSESPPSFLHEDCGEVSTSQASTSYNAQAASKWSEFFKPPPVPLCKDHGIPTKLWAVNKSGLNKGRRFYLCSK